MTLKQIDMDSWDVSKNRIEIEITLTHTNNADLLTVLLQRENFKQFIITVAHINIKYWNTAKTWKTAFESTLTHTKMLTSYAI